MTSFRANGKLLLTGEYAVLDGALALALPTKPGQTFDFEAGKEYLHWRSIDVNGACWFEAVLESPAFSLKRCTDAAAGERLAQILQTAQRMNPDFAPRGEVTTRLEFSRHWGLGTSSTLIANVAAWAGVDPFGLLDKTFGGSGYDVACASAAGPLLFQRRQGMPHFVEIPFDPPFADCLYFVYLGQKQDSREGIRRYRERAALPDGRWLDSISQIAIACAAAGHLKDFESLLLEHERLIAGVIGLPPVQNTLFSGFEGAVKSLGAWGGDFVLVTSKKDDKETRADLKRRGLETAIAYKDMALRH